MPGFCVDDGGSRGNYNLNDYQRGEKDFVLRGGSGSTSSKNGANQTEPEKLPRKLVIKIWAVIIVVMLVASLLFISLLKLMDFFVAR